jgi:hypothetical protein
MHSQIQVSQAEVRKITLDQIQMARQQTALFKCPDSGHPLPVQSIPSTKIELNSLSRVLTKLGEYQQQKISVSCNFKTNNDLSTWQQKERSNEQEKT